MLLLRSLSHTKLFLILSLWERSVLSLVTTSKKQPNCIDQSVNDQTYDLQLEKNLEQQ